MVAAQFKENFRFFPFLKTSIAHLLFFSKIFAQLPGERINFPPERGKDSIL